MKLNLGCGRNPIDGFVNLDRAALSGVDVVHDLEQFPLPFDDDTFDEILGVDLIEHITDALGLMAELWRIAKPGCVCTFALPYGSSDDAWEDPTHVRPYYVNSWMYFAQPTYYRAQYGYWADWQIDKIVLDTQAGGTAQEVQTMVMSMRNIVQRQVVELRAVKPAREPLQALWENPQILFNRR